MSDAPIPEEESGDQKVEHIEVCKNCNVRKRFLLPASAYAQYKLGGTVGIIFPRMPLAGRIFLQYHVCLKCARLQSKTALSRILSNADPKGKASLEEKGTLTA